MDMTTTRVTVVVLIVVDKGLFVVVAISPLVSTCTFVLVPVGALLYLGFTPRPAHSQLRK